MSASPCALCPICGNHLDPGAPCVSCLAHALWSDDARPRSVEDAIVDDTELMIPGYRLEGVLGRGGMGIIYRAVQLDPERMVALKVLLVGRLASIEAQERFMREVAIVAKLRHPGIIEVYEGGFAKREGLFYYAMPLLEKARPLTVYASTHCETIDARLSLFQQVLKAMQHAHECGVIHRDLKPSNVQVGDDGQPKVLDFGLAKWLEPDADRTQLSMEGQVLGTPAYMSPEQAAGDPHVGVRSDVYSLGVMLYEVLVGTPPFSVKTTNRISEMHETLDKIQNAPHPRLPDEIPIDLRAIVDRSLNKVPEKRYASAQAFHDDLQRFLDHLPVEARPLSSTQRRWLWLKRHPLHATAWCLGLALLLTFAIGGSWTAHRQGVLLEALAERDRARQEEWVRQVMDLPFDWLPPLVAALREVGPGVEALVERELVKPDRTEEEEMRLRALLASPANVPYLNETFLQTKDLGTAIFLRDCLAPHQEDLVPLWWERAESADHHWPARYRALLGLARYDPLSEKWGSYKGLLVAVTTAISHEDWPKLHYAFGSDLIQRIIVPELRKQMRAWIRAKPKRDRISKIPQLLAAWVEGPIRSHTYRLMLSDEGFRKHIGNLEAHPEDALALLHSMDASLRETRSLATPDAIYYPRRARVLLALMQLDPKARAWGHLRHPMKMRDHLMPKYALLELTAPKLYHVYQGYAKNIHSHGVKQGIAQWMILTDKDGITSAMRDHIIAEQQAILASKDPLIDPRSKTAARELLRELAE